MVLAQLSTHLEGSQKGLLHTVLRKIKFQLHLKFLSKHNFKLLENLNILCKFNKIRNLNGIKKRLDHICVKLNFACV